MVGLNLENRSQLPAPALITCPKCKNTITLITYSRAAFVACGFCLRLYETRGKDLSFLESFTPDSKIKPVIPLGSKGKFNEVMYAVVGFASFKELNYAYYWRELVLFNPIHGYAILAEYDGHWNFFRFISDYTHGKAHQGSFDYNELKFNLYNQYRTELLYAEGEFFWDIRDQNSTYSEYVAPPYMITRILSSRELTWMLGEYAKPEKIQAAFNVTQEMPLQSGIGASEPFSKGFSFEFLKNLALGALFLLIAIQAFLSFTCKETLLHSSQYNLPAYTVTNNLPAQPGPTITINNSLTGKANLQFRLQAPVDNNWLSIGVTLINTQSHHEYDFEMGVEYYSGYSGGESWSEGNQVTEKMISALPAGTYQVLLQPYREDYSSIHEFNLRIVADVPIWSNFWITAALILLFPAIHWLREYTFEKRRWMNSDYTPYK